MKHADTSPQALIDLVRSVGDLQLKAVQAYRPVVEDILRTDCCDAGHIERTLDGLLDFCGHDAILALYKALCRRYRRIDHEATAFYIQAYAEVWDSEDQGGEV